jgi:hypothetical protein
MWVQSGNPLVKTIKPGTETPPPSSDNRKQKLIINNLTIKKGEREQ